jgi:hypothetical protein
VEQDAILFHLAEEISMNSEDPVTIHLSLIARMLEAAGYAIEVDYTTATITVWLDQWPVTVEVKRRTGFDKLQFVAGFGARPSHQATTN